MGGSSGLAGAGTFLTSVVFYTGLGGEDGGKPSDGLLYGIGPGGLTRGIDWWIDTVAFF